MHKLAIFASGSGTNAENIIQYFQNKPLISVSCICTNNPDAYVIQRAQRYNLDVLLFSRDDFYKSHKVIEYLEKLKVNWIILAGFLWLVPEYLIDTFQNRMLNIHPALLPKYGGKGMYGERVHRTVIENKEKQSGMTIHLVNREYDKGRIVFQATCPVLPEDTPETLANRIHQLEYEHYPKVIEKLILGEIQAG